MTTGEQITASAGILIKGITDKLKTLREGVPIKEK